MSFKKHFEVVIRCLFQESNVLLEMLFLIEVFVSKCKKWVSKGLKWALEKGLKFSLNSGRLTEKGTPGAYNSTDALCTLMGTRPPSAPVTVVLISGASL